MATARLAWPKQVFQREFARGQLPFVRIPMLLLIRHVDKYIIVIIILG